MRERSVRPYEPAPTVAVPGREGMVKTSATARAMRRAYDGSPPVIAHAPIGAACTQCHNERGVEVPLEFSRFEEVVEPTVS